MGRRTLGAAAFLLLLAGGSAHAHPSAPALLDVSERGDASVDVLWKTPRRGASRDLSPRLSTGCLEETPRSRAIEGTGVVERWRIRCDGVAFGELEVEFDSLVSSTTAVVLRVRPFAGPVATRLATSHGPHRLLGPEVEARAPDATFRGVLGFVGLGTEHLLLGPDHVLFVVLLTALIGWGRRLFWTLTCFTLGHSVTLGLATLGVVAFPTRLIEALIALSVVGAAAELARPGRRGLLRRAPFVVATGFGLLHGMGFAGALAQLQVPADELPLALLSFNLGIELGQLAVVAPVLAVAWIGSKASPGIDGRLPGALRALPGYAMGTLAALWFWQQLGVA